MSRLSLSFVLGVSIWAGSARADDWSGFGRDGLRSRISGEVSGARFDADVWRHQWTNEGMYSDRAYLATPALGDGFVALATRRDLVEVVREHDGRRLWQAAPGAAVFASPAIARGLAYVFGVDQTLTAFRLRDGSIAWRKDLGAMGYSSPVVLDDSVYVATGVPRPRIYRLEAATGATIWEAGAGHLTNSAMASVAVAGGHVVVSQLEGRTFSFAAADGAWQWTAEVGGRVALSSPLVVGDRVYFVPGGASARVHSLALATGAPIAGWPRELPLPAPAAGLRARQYVTSSLAGDGIIVFSVRADDRFGASASTGDPTAFVSQEWLYAIDAGGQVLWSSETGRISSANPNDVPDYELVPTPVLFRGTAGALLVAQASSLAPVLRVFSGDGELLWSKPLAAPARSSPVFANGRLLVATDAGVVESFLSDSNRPPIAPVLGFAPSAGVETDAAHTVIRWGAAVDPEGALPTYQIRVDDDGELLESWDLEVTSAPGKQALMLPPLAGGRYVYAVRARDPAGAFSSWSDRHEWIAVGSPAVTVDGQPATSLAAAIAGAPSGGLIRLGAGRYVLGETLRLPAGARLAGAGPHLTTISGRGLAIVLAPATGARIEALTVADAEVGVSVDGATGVELRNVILRDNREAGLHVAAAAAAALINGTVVRNGSGVRALGATDIRNTLVTGNEVGIAAPGALGQSRYSNVYGNRRADHEGGAPDPTDLAAPVAFLAGDQHELRLRAGQPSTDRGDPADDFSNEPAPNGGRINIGAFGNTAFAELSEAVTPADADPPAADAGTVPMDAEPDAGVTDGPTPAADAPGPHSVGQGGCACDVGGTAPQGALALLVPLFGLGFLRRFQRSRKR